MLAGPSGAWGLSVARLVACFVGPVRVRGGCERQGAGAGQDAHVPGAFHSAALQTLTNEGIAMERV